MAVDIAAQQQELKRQSDALYAQHVKPLEATHRGKFAAVSTNGRTVLADSLMEASEQGLEQLGVGTFVFKVGERAVGKWR